MKLPSFQFYPGDWKKDPELNRASKAEKGMLMDSLCLLWECEDRGMFATAGNAWTDDDIASAVGGDKTENLSLLHGLLRKGILRRNKSGVVYSSRMVRDEEARKQAVKDGKRGGNPHLKGGVKGDANPKPTPSSSSSSSVSSSTAKIKTVNVANGASPSSQNNNHDETLIEEIVSAFKDEGSRGSFISMARRHGDGLLREAFADVQDRIRCGEDIRNPGAFMTGLIKKWTVKV